MVTIAGQEFSQTDYNRALQLIDIKAGGGRIVSPYESPGALKAFAILAEEPQYREALDTAAQQKLRAGQLGFSSLAEYKGASGFARVGGQSQTAIAEKKAIQQAQVQQQARTRTIQLTTEQAQRIQAQNESLIQRARQQEQVNQSLIYSGGAPKNVSYNISQANQSRLNQTINIPPTIIQTNISAEQLQARMDYVLQTPVAFNNVSNVTNPSLLINQSRGEYSALPFFSNIKEDIKTAYETAKGGRLITAAIRFTGDVSGSFVELQQQKERLPQFSFFDITPERVVKEKYTSYGQASQQAQLKVAPSVGSALPFFSLK